MSHHGRPFSLLTAFALGMAVLGTWSGHLVADESVVPPGAGSVSVEDCAGCHDDQIAAFRRGPHSILELDAGLAARFGRSGCQGCHGDPAPHLDSGGEPGNLFAFSDAEPAPLKSARCLECHADAHPRFLRTRHAAAGLDCTSCHSAHSSDPTSRSLLHPALGVETGDSAGTVSATCAGCHGEVFASFGFNERHRLQEGILDCASCHDPHEPQPRLALGGFKQDGCVGCHADKGGPFVFEHGAQRVEGCIACHEPHGSPNRHLLTFQSVAELCYSCHVAVPGFHTRFTADSICTNCHSTIHGSNFDPAFLK